MGGERPSLVRRRPGERFALAKKVLLSLMVVGTLGLFTVHRVAATFSTEARNSSSSVSSGTLTFDTSVNGGAPCTTYGGPSSPGNVNTCTAAFTYNAAAELYPGDSKTTTFALKNDGSIGTGTLRLYMPALQLTPTLIYGCAAAATPDSPSPGGGNPCDVAGLQIYVQETDSLGTATKCWFPSGTTTCVFANNAMYVFAHNYYRWDNGLNLGSGPAANGTRYFTIGVRMPSTASNTLQGEEGVFSLTWRMSS